MQTHIAKGIGVDRDERLGHAVDERLAADKTNFGMRLRARDQMFAAAETDFEPRLVGPMRKQARKIFRGGRREIDASRGSNVSSQRRLRALERMPLAAAVEGARARAMRCRTLQRIRQCRSSKRTWRPAR